MTAPTDTATVAAPRRRRSRAVRYVAWSVAALAVLVLAAPLVAAAAVLVGSRGDDRTPTDVVVVLGAAQFDGRPSPVLGSRLSHAAELYRRQVAPRVVTVGSNQPGDRTTEAAVGAEWLVGAGVPSDRVVAVPAGHDTLSSLTAVAALMARSGWSSATIVTDPAHEARSLAMARALGIAATGSPTGTGAGSSLTVDYVVRETEGLLYFWLAERRSVDPVVGG